MKVNKIKPLPVKKKVRARKGFTNLGNIDPFDEKFYK